MTSARLRVCIGERREVTLELSVAEEADALTFTCPSMFPESWLDLGMNAGVQSGASGTTGASCG